MNTYSKTKIFEENKRDYFERFYLEKGWEWHRREDIETQRKYDLSIYTGNRWIRIEEKYRNKNYEDLLVEVVQSSALNEDIWLGWIYSIKADYIFYASGTTYENMIIHQIKVKELKKFIEYNCLRGFEFDLIYCNKIYSGAINYAIPWAPLIYLNIARKIK